MSIEDDVKRIANALEGIEHILNYLSEGNYPLDRISSNLTNLDDITTKLGEIADNINS